MQDNCVFKAGFSQLSIYRIFCVDESVYRVIAGPTQIIVKLRVPQLPWTFDAGLGPHSITLICCGFVFTDANATTTVEIYNRTGLLQRLQQVYNKLYNKSR